MIESGGYIDIELIRYIGSDTFEKWLTNHPGNYTVYDLLEDFEITDEELQEIVHPDIYEQYIQYRD
mgnify:FL=1